MAFIVDYISQTGKSKHLPHRVYMLNILIIDDEEQNLELMKFYLESHCNCSIKEAMSGNEAIELLHTNPSFDFIISDFRMSNGSGLELLQYFSTTNIKANFILHTSYFDGELPIHDDRFLGIVSKHNYSKLSQLVLK